MVFGFAVSQVCHYLVIGNDILGRQVASGPAFTLDRYRTFTSTKGTTVRAEFIEFHFQGSRVLLRKEDGSPLDVSMNDLSKEDQQWVKDELKRRKR